MSIDFHATVAGQRFFGYDMPELVKSVKQLAIAAERIADHLESTKTYSASSSDSATNLEQDSNAHS